MQIPVVAERQLRLLCFLRIHVLRDKDSLGICAVALWLSFSRALSDNDQVSIGNRNGELREVWCVPMIG